MKFLKSGTIKRLHVDRKIVARNRREGTRDPAITIQTSKGPVKTRWAQIIGSSIFVQSDDKPLSCGARLWIETRAEVAYE